MKVQTRLYLNSSIVFGVIFAIISILIYGVYYNNTKKMIDKNLNKTTHLVALFYLEEDELNKDDFSKIKRQFEEYVPNSYYQIYNEHNEVSYGSQAFVLSAKQLDEVRQKEELFFSSETFFCHGIYYEDNQGDFVVVARERKDVVDNQLQMLLWILIIAFVIGMLAIIFLNKLIADMAYRPFRLVIRQVENISTNNLDVQIKLPDTKDELQDLIKTFNSLILKISETFKIQRNFVSYVSHEFKTPLTAMQGNLEVFSIKDRSPEEYNKLTQTLIEQIEQLEGIINTLIIISDLRNDSDINTSIRIDELIWEIINKLYERYSDAEVYVDINIQPEKEQLLQVPIERTQLMMALFNIIENAIKYTKNRKVNICILEQDNRLCISIKDEGIGIPADELAYISKPFYRADNTNQIQGSGIGLSIALRILEKSNIEYQIKSEINIGTEVVLKF